MRLNKPTHINDILPSVMRKIERTRAKTKNTYTDSQKEKTRNEEALK